MSFSNTVKALCLVGCLSLVVAPSSAFVVSPRKARRRSTAVATSHSMSTNEEEDIFSYFDPLLSPHAYPDGISPDHKPNKDLVITDEDRQMPTRFRKRSTEAPEVDPTLLFDPTLSPHAYPEGTPSLIVGDEVPVSAKKKKIGILLIDHGSKKQASNDRLHKLARVYQDSVDSNAFVVKASHMEIANPSVPEGLQSLLDEGVDEIICHPYFLSPDGRHVSDDIPEILNDAIESLNIEVPLITTEPVGANMDLMVQVVRSICEESKSKVIGQQND